MNISLTMELQIQAMAYLPLFFAVTVICAALLLSKVKRNTTKLCKPVTETGRDKGELVLGYYDITMLYKPVMETNRDKGELVLGN